MQLESECRQQQGGLKVLGYVLETRRAVIVPP